MASGFAALMLPIIALSRLWYVLFPGEEGKS